ncbi:LytTR family DNA-binding domain-containing protein [Streptomyces sp. DSM 44917]|uniref:LytTR family DNA-binding domain-containing protein n=1 Tax=Streptomyces boetiae TaxID=3075541 RepID=A0ABU2LBM0_9ACTN|nr:LytTR family DNA-binding domain-containing protein [Streptomyces sp. DSM 44917]MDT0308588.1 LytTR family DNA-binding domain-containing protein [Streptomyces sp. DSM 44917]
MNAEGMPSRCGLRVLVVEDEAATRQELVRMLGESPDVAGVTEADGGEAAVRLLGSAAFDAVFLDITMPGLDGMALARVLGQLSGPPAIVFVTASEQHAVEAFGVGAADYLLKPVRAERLAEAVARAAAALPRSPAGPGAPPARAADELAVVRVETGRHTVFVRRDDIQFAAAHGDYVRLHTAGDSHLVRLSLAYLEEAWAPAGFVRAHRGYLVAIRWISDLWVSSSAGLVARTPAGDVPVSRRHARAVKERLFAHVRDAAQ